VLNNTTFRGGGIWYHSEPQRANGTEQGQPTYGAHLPIVQRGPVPWLTIDQIGHEKSIRLDVHCQSLADLAEVYYCENWDFPSPLLIDAQGFAGYRAVSSLAELRRDLVYTLTVVRPGRLSMPFRAISQTELEILQPLQPGETVEVWYDELLGEDVLGPPLRTEPLLQRRVDRFPISAQQVRLGRPRLRLSGQPANESLFVGRAGELPPLVRVTGSWKDVQPFEAEQVPVSTRCSACRRWRTRWCWRTICR